jgi:pimeloyl-ACP methyl ester carboxylesterase
MIGGVAMALVLSLSLSLSLPPDEAPAPRLVGELATLKTDTGTLHGIIDLPARPGPWPVVILHAGSGPTDRDGNGPLVRTDNLKILGRTLAGGGVAVLRIDKRGIAASSKALAKEEDVRLETYAADAAAWAARLREDPRFTKVGFIGHSEGAITGLIAAKDAKFDCYVSLCGPGRPLQDILREQLKKNLPEDLYKTSDTIITELEAGRAVKEIPKGLEALFRPSVQPFLASAFKHDPAKLAAEFPGPLLVVSGSTDIQVSAEDAKRLGGANAKAKVVTIDGMNHVLKAVEGTHRLVQLSSYTDPTLPLHPKLVPELAAFLKQSLGGK